MFRTIIAALILLPRPALAHTGDHSGSGLLHVLTQPEHLALLALAGVIAVVAFVTYRARR